MSLRSAAGNIDSMLANFNNAVFSNEKLESNAEMNHYFSTVGRKTTGALIKKTKPVNITPAGRGRPYCRHKEFLKMPQYSLDAVSEN